MFLRGGFELQRVDIRDTRADGLVAEWSEGRIVESRFADVGRVGLALRGSRVEVLDTSFERVRAQAVLAVDESDLHARGLRVSTADSGVASANGSSASVEDSVFEAIAGVGLAAYRLRPDHVPGTLRAERVQIDARGATARTDDAGSLFVDGVAVEPDPAH